MNKVLVSGYVGFNNFGDEAIFYVLSSKLKSLGCEVSVLCNNKKETERKYSVNTYFYKNIIDIIKGILSNDIIVSGGGSLLQNKTSNFSLYYYLLILFFAKLCFKKAIIFAQGIEPIKGEFQEKLLKFVLKKLDFICVRDENSKNYLKKLGIDSILVSDPVYSILQTMQIEEEKEGLVIQLREANGIDDEFLNNLANIIKEKNISNIKILSFQDEIDKEVCEKFSKKLNILGIKNKLILQTSIKETINIVNKAKFMISTRLHGAIAANALKTQIFALNYDEKLKTLTQELNIQNINLDNFSYEELKNKLDVFFFASSSSFKEYRRFEWNKVEDFFRSSNGK